MKDSNSSNQSSLKKDDILTLANTIYSCLGIDKEIESEDELYSDEVYIEIISVLIPDLQEEISPGTTPEEKVDIIKVLLSLLGKLIEADFSIINPKKLIMNKDKKSAQNFLELLLELINTLMNVGEEMEDDDELGKQNKSYEYSNKKKLKSNSFEKEGQHKFNKDDEINIDDIESLKLSQDKKSGKKSNKKDKNESEEIKIELDKEKSQSGEDMLLDKEKDEPEEEKNNKIKNISKDNSEEKKNGEEDDDDLNKNNLNSNKKSYDIPALLEEDEKEKKEKKKKIKNEFNNDDYDNEEEDEYSSKKNKYNFQGSDEDLSSNNFANSVPRPFNMPSLTNNNSSMEYGESLLKKGKEKEKYNKEEDEDFDYNYNEEVEEKNLNKNSNTNSLANSNISLHSKKSKKSNKIVDSKLEESSHKKISSKKNVQESKHKTTNNNSTKKEKAINTIKNQNEDENNNEVTESQDISKSSIYTIHQGSAVSSKRSNKIEKNTQKKNTKSNKSNISKKSSIKDRSSNSTIINNEIPLDDQGFKTELIKELKKIYGNKIGKTLQGPNNSFSNLDLIIQDLKLAKKQERLMKKGNQNLSESKEKISAEKNDTSVDGISPMLNKEFILKNEKQLQIMLQIYNQKLKSRQNEQEKYIRDLSQNVQFMRKIKELEGKKLENEIERKKDIYKNNTNEVEELYYIRKIYENYYQLEAEKCAREIDKIRQVNHIKLKERDNNIEEMKNYYKDKIAILKEIGRRERIKNRRSKMEDELIYLQLNSIPKRDLKRKLKQIVNSLEDDFFTNEQEIENNNQEEIEKIIDNYYQK